MKKLFIFLVTITLSMALGMALVACKNDKPAKDEPNEGSRFVTVENKSMIYKIVADKKTGVMYAVSLGGYNCGSFTLLVDQDGKPLIWEEAIK